MAGRAPTPTDLTNARPVWCLNLSWGGKVFRLAEELVDITLPDASEVTYVDALSTVDWVDEIAREGIQESNSVPLAVFLDGTDIAEQIARARPLSTVSGELFMVLVDRITGDSKQTYAQRFRYLTGRLVGAQYADPDGHPSMLSFNLEDSAGADSSLILDSEAAINPTTWSTADSELEGKVYPLIIGQPGLYRRATGVAVGTSGSPAYVLTRSGDDAQKLLIAGHEVVATTILIYDEAGEGQTFNVTGEQDGLGRVCSVVDVSGATGSFDLTDTQFWASWTTGGGIRSPFSTSAVSGLGDVCALLLLRTSLRVDFQKWIAEGDLLNRVKIDTYVNEPTLTPWSFVTRLLDSMLVEVRSGPDGLYPQARMLDQASAEGVTTLTEDEDLEAVSGVTNRSRISEIINQTTIRFAQRAKTGDYRRNVIVTPEPNSADPEAFSDEYAVISVNRWSTDPVNPIIQAESIELDFIYDDTTAALIARERVRVQGIGYSTRDYIGDYPLGYLSPGDTFRFDSESLYRTGMLVEILSKRWTGEAWLFTLAFDEDPVRDSSTHKSG